MAADTLPVINNEADERYEVSIEGALAVLEYKLRGKGIAMLHTEVPESLGGRGVGGQLARFALDDARRRGLLVTPLCPFVAAYIRRHHEYLDIVAEPYREQLRRTAAT